MDEYHILDIERVRRETEEQAHFKFLQDHV